ncbi:DMT family transporter [Pseudooceanicola sp. LIPI14-2-Ac024]|uniref:DMT family transporter n=1 Tax=Pseudooceanicola sp. LIPI14-2-Ac024 TaxID=3344875 RepID=UPI0035D06385
MTDRNAPARAIALIMVATAFIAMTTLLAKAVGGPHLGTPLHPLQVSHGRFLFALMLIGTLCAVRRQQVRDVHWGWHALRTTFGWGGATLMFAAAARMPLSDATAISFLSPVFAMLLAIPLLGEKVGPVRWTAAGFALVGMLILLRPTAGAIQPAAMLALCAAVSMGAEAIFIKRLSGSEPPLQVLLINNSLGLCIATLAVLPVWQMPSTEQWAGLAGIGVAMALAQICYVNAMRMADASFVVPFTYATLIWAALYDAAVFGVIPDLVSWTGAAVIVAGGVLLAWREARRGTPVPPAPLPGDAAPGE